MKKLLFCLALIVSMLASGQTIKKIGLDFSKEQFQLKNSGFESKGQITKEIIPAEAGFYLNEIVGAPALPVHSSAVAMPNGAVFKSVTLDYDKELIASDIVIEPTQKLVTTNKMDDPYLRVEADETIYNSNAQYPVNSVDYNGTEYTSDYTIFNFSVSPLIYNPVEKKLYLLKNISLNVEYDLNGNRNVKRWDDGIFSEIVKDKVINPQDVVKTSVREAKDGDVEYLIITKNSLTSAFDNLAQWKTQKGVPAEVVSVEDIYSNYSGATNQLKIKNCIKDYYENKGTVWVLLGGDDSVVPDQNVYLQIETTDETTVDNTCPGDLFYACFDNAFDWNEDGDDKVGEMSDNVDLGQEVMIGRAPVRTSPHANAFVNKTVSYEKNRPETDFGNKLLLTGLSLFDPSPQTPSDAEDKSEMMYRNYIQNNWNGEKSKMYDSATDFSDGGSYNVTATTLENRFNEGFGLTHMATHGSQQAWSAEGGWYGGSFDTSDAAGLNNEKQGIIVTIACITNAFDSDGDTFYHDPCLSEAFIRNANGGAIGYVGSSRFGLGYTGHNVHGASFKYNDMFFKYLFQGQPSDNKYKFGSVMAKAKAYWSGSAASNEGMRWIHMNLNHIGDPELDILTADPTEMAINVPAQIPAGVSSSVTIATGVEDALVCLTQGDNLYEAGKTNSSGEFTCSVAPVAGEDITVTITAHNRITEIKNIAVSVDGVNPPQNLTATQVGHNVLLSWESPAKGFQNYVVKRDGATLSANFSGLTYTDSEVAEGSHTYQVVAVYDDGEAAASYTIVVANGIVLPYTTDFESGTSDWELEGTWGLSTAASHSSSHSLSESPSGDYDANKNISATLSGINLSGEDVSDATLKFWLKYEIEAGFDYMYLEATADNGKSWNQLKAYDGEVDWSEEIIPLGAFVGNTNVAIRFRFKSDSGAEEDGMYIDDLEITVSNQDLTAPLIVHEGPYGYQGVEGINTIEAELIDVSDIAEAKLIYSIDDGNEHTVVSSGNNGNEYTFALPAQTSGSLVTYKISAEDSEGNIAESEEFKYVAGVYVSYGDFEDEEIRSIAKIESANGVNEAVAVRISVPEGKTAADLTTVLIRNYTDTNTPIDDMEIHVWGVTNDGTSDVPGDDLITPFTVSPAADVAVDAYAFTVVDMRDVASQLSGVTGDFYIGIMMNSGETRVVFTSYPEANEMTDRSVAYVTINDETKWAHIAYTGNDGIQSIPAYNFSAVFGTVNGIEEGELTLPETAVLYQNYPNPFNPNTTIKFYNHNDGNVKLAVYNVKGEMVQQLVNTNMKSGNHSINFNAGNLNSGVYYYSLQTGSKTLTKKMIMVK